ncbi:hypothetical protein HHI36_015689 [Cryptolaemus montrouzieri]|uniref:Peptidyl-prolyl cis-trans isomerase n=1 Tax=Cryptolaemus montrouzieri TaxID=559131 RepID=A0ABD2N6R6_9CUCU
MESPEIEELTLCGYCKKKFNDTDQSPKLLSCKHYFCLQCMRTNLSKGTAELYCVYCWKKTDLGELGPESLPTHNPVLCLTKNFSQLKLFSNNSTSSGTSEKTKVISENCHTHAMPLALWCTTCGSPVCRACATTSDHSNHQIKSQNEAKDQLIAELQVDLASMTKMLSEIQRLASQQREFLLKVLEACVTLKTHVEADLTNNVAHFEVTETRENLAKLRLNLSMAESLTDVHNLCASVNLEKQKFQMRYQEMYLQCQLDDLIRHSTIILDFPLLKQALGNIHNGEVALPGNSRILPPSQQNPILFLANYCMSQLYSRHMLAKSPPNNGLDYHNHNSLPPPLTYMNQTPPHQHLVLPPPKNIYQDNNIIMQNLVHSPQIRNPVNMCPLYYFNVDVNGQPLGRIVIEVRADVAPKMAKNFGVLTTGEAGMGYKGCQIFQCWEGESVITGDFELNNGRGGRSIFEDSYFLPDDTKLLAVRGTVGMRRTQKRHDNLGMVGSQFRIILQEMRGFTGIFGHVVEGLELVEKISTYGDTAGKPTKNILIAKCGKL